MNTGVSLPFKLFLVGMAWLAVFGALLLLPVQWNEGALLTRITFFIGLIPPPVCFGAGLGMAPWKGVRADVRGAWLNGGALFLHGLGIAAVLQRVLG
jgi:hypothetical protein